MHLCADEVTVVVHLLTVCQDCWMWVRITVMSRL